MGEGGGDGGSFPGGVVGRVQCLDLDPGNAVVLANRSLCWMRLGQSEKALVDAREARQLRPDWPKACYREGAALRLLEVRGGGPCDGGGW